MEKSHVRRNPRQNRSQERFDKIVEIAANLFLDRGFYATTTNEIASQAEISIGSLYQYFENKEAIVEALAERYVAALREVAADVVASDVQDLSTADAVNTLLDPILKFHLSHPEFRTLWLAAEISPELRSSLRAMDQEVLGRVEGLLKARVTGLPPKRAQIIVAVMGIALKSLLALVGPSHSIAMNAQTATEFKRMLTLYIDDIVREQNG